MITRAILLSAINILLGCNIEQIEQSMSDQDNETRFIELAHRYLYDVVSLDEAQKTLQQVEDLTPEYAQKFARALYRIQGTDDLDGDRAALLALSQQVDKLALEQRMNRFARLGDDSLFTQSLQGESPSLNASNLTACQLPTVPCNWTSYWPISYLTGSCATCLTNNGIWSDRMSNSACEEVACDHRIAYSLGHTPTLASGRTPAAVCIVSYYTPGLLGAYASNTAYALFGIRGPVACGLISNVNNYLRTYTYVF